jgi:hypothetical protein
MSTIYTEGYGNIAEFYNQSASMQSADVTKSIDDLGAYAMMQVMQYAIPTAALHLNDRFEYICSKPWKYPELWLACLVVAGESIRDINGNKIYPLDFEVKDDNILTLIKQEVSA